MSPPESLGKKQCAGFDLSAIPSSSDARGIVAPESAIFRAAWAKAMSVAADPRAGGSATSTTSATSAEASAEASAAPVPTALLPFTVRMSSDGAVTEVVRTTLARTATLRLGDASVAKSTTPPPTTAGSTTTSGPAIGSKPRAWVLSVAVSLTDQKGPLFVTAELEVTSLRLSGQVKYSVISLYLGVVLTAGRFFRFMFQGSSQRAIMEEMPNPQLIIDIVQGVGIARQSRQLMMELMLYDTLMKLLRSPTLLMRIGGLEVKGYGMFRTAEEKRRYHRRAIAANYDYGEGHFIAMERAMTAA